MYTRNINLGSGINLKGIPFWGHKDTFINLEHCCIQISYNLIWILFCSILGGKNREWFKHFRERHEMIKELMATHRCGRLVMSKTLANGHCFAWPINSGLSVRTKAKELDVPCGIILIIVLASKHTICAKFFLYLLIKN